MSFKMQPQYLTTISNHNFYFYRCGNGLLTHILLSCGYAGYGIDVRARTSWAYYPSETRQRLIVRAFDPVAVLSPELAHPSMGVDNPDTDPHLPPGVFLIGNHADELTPWLPLLATLLPTTGYLSIPCCGWALDGRYERGSEGNSYFNFGFPAPNSEIDTPFIESLHLGGSGGHTTSYAMYRIWLASLSAHCGWVVECDTLRIPSTRAWAVAGKCRVFPS